MAKVSTKDIMSLQESLELLTKIATGDVKETVVVATEYGTEEVQKEADLRTRISALREIIRNQPTQADALRDAQIIKLRKETAILQKKLDNLDNTDTNNDLTIELDNEPKEVKDNDNKHED